MELTEQRTAPNSVELQRAKDGAYYFTIKIYFEAGEEAATVEKIAAIDADLRARFINATP